MGILEAIFAALAVLGTIGGFLFGGRSARNRYEAQKGKDYVDTRKRIDSDGGASDRLDALDRLRRREGQ